MPALTASPRAARRADPGLDAIGDKLAAGERLTLEDGDLLYTTPDLWTLCALADTVRRRLHGDIAYYNINRHLNYSNVCALSCKFCEFYRKEGQDGAYTRDLAYIRAEARKAVEAGATEIHIVGGLNPYLPFSYYTDMLNAIREESEACRHEGTEARRHEEEESGVRHQASGAPTAPGEAVDPNGLSLRASLPSCLRASPLHIKAFTAVEIVHFARIAKVWKGASLAGEEGRQARLSAIRWVLERLKQAGLGSLPGGGAETFDDRVHDEAFKGKIRSDVWLDVHRVAHELGLNTNATILYGHIEDRHERLVHMDMLRRAQDEALARMGYQGTPGLSESSSEDPDGSPTRAPIITLTRPNTPLPEHVAFGSADAQCLMPDASFPGYFQTIIPLPFLPDGSDLEHLPGPGGLENLRTLAISRLMLDNFPHVKAFWIMQTLPMAQLMLQSGADDIDGTVVWYDITKVAGASTHQEVTVHTLQKAIREAGFVPVERDTLYRRVLRAGHEWNIKGTS